MARILQARTGLAVVEYGFLDADAPTIPEGVDRCVSRGAREIIVLLNFLNSGKHVARDIPMILEDCRKKHPGIQILMTPPIGMHPGIADLFVDLIARSQDKGKELFYHDESRSKGNPGERTHL